MQITITVTIEAKNDMDATALIRSDATPEQLSAAPIAVQLLHATYTASLDEASKFLQSSVEAAGIGLTGLAYGKHDEDISGKAEQQVDLKRNYRNN